MNLQPSNSIYGNDRRELFAWELAYGGTGQFTISGAVIAPPNNVIYSIDFHEDSTIGAVGFRDKDDAGNTLYNINSSLYVGWTFPAGTTWTAPITSITLTSGRGLAYTYTISNNTLQTLY